MLDDIIDVFRDLLLVGHAFGDCVGSCRVDLLGQVEEEVEVTVFQVALFDIFVLADVLFQVFFGGLVSGDAREVRFFDDCELVVFGGTEGDLYQQEFWLEFSHVLAADNERRKGISWSI